MSEERDEGQAAVELALVLPLVLMLLLVIVQVSTVARDQILVVHAARAGARAAAVARPGEGPAEARVAAAESLGDKALKSGRLTVDTRKMGAPDHRVAVKVVYRAPTRVPVVGALVGDVRIRSEAVMREEQP